MPACACAACVLVSVQNLATGHLAGASAAYGFNGPNTSWQNRHLGPPFHCLPWLDSALGPRGRSSVGVPLVASPGALPWWCETVWRGIGRTSRLSGDLTVASCMTPKVRSLDGVVCVLLCVGLNPCRLHVVLHKMSNLPDLQKRCYLSHEGGDSINCSIAP